MNSIQGIFDTKETKSYAEILAEIQKYISEDGKDTINKLKNDIFKENGDEDSGYLKTAIEDYILKFNLRCREEPDRENLVNKLYDSMVRFDFLTPYLMDDEFIIDNGVEEINANAWDEIYITDKNGIHLVENGFCSPEQALTTITAIATKLDKTLNESTPVFLGEIRKNIRIACAIAPIVDEDKAITFSIRMVSVKSLDRADFVEYGSYTNEQMDMLEALVKNGVSVLFSGATFSGKTATMNYLLSYLSQDKNRRIGTIEIEAREFNLSKYDENGVIKNNVFSWVTKESTEKDRAIDANALEELMMRFSPEIIGIGEMRNKEAMITCEVATTGHTVITTTHSRNARTAYDRVVMLCKKANMGYDDATLYKLAIEAFPVVVFQRRYPDKNNKRVCAEIVEGLGYANGKVMTRTLYSYDARSDRHTKHNDISEELVKIMYDNGAQEEDILKARGFAVGKPIRTH